MNIVCMKEVNCFKSPLFYNRMTSVRDVIHSICQEMSHRLIVFGSAFFISNRRTKLNELLTSEAVT